MSRTPRQPADIASHINEQFSASPFDARPSAPVERRPAVTDGIAGLPPAYQTTRDPGHTARHNEHAPEPTQKRSKASPFSGRSAKYDVFFSARISAATNEGIEAVAIDKGLTTKREALEFLVDFYNAHKKETE